MGKQKQNNSYINSSLEKTLESLKPSILKLVPTFEQIDLMTASMRKTMERMVEITKPLVEAMTKYQINYSGYFSELQKTLEKVKENPDSIINWIEYSNKLKDYIWTIPYNISGTELQKIFETIDCEEEFDNYMISYYSDEVMKSMTDEIRLAISDKHCLLFEQIIRSFEREDYSLSNIGLMSIIDELCSYFLEDKGRSTRKDMFEPILNDSKFDEELDAYFLDVLLLNSNINTIYECIDFNSEIEISTNKKARRNPSQHVRFYSDRRIDSIMLMNTIYNLLLFQRVGSKYHSKLKYNRTKKKFEL